MKTTESHPLPLEALHDVRARWRRNKILEVCFLALAGAAKAEHVLPPIHRCSKATRRRRACKKSGRQSNWTAWRSLKRKSAPARSLNLAG